MRFSTSSIVVAVAASLNAEMVHASCGSAFCVLNTNWATQGVASEPGTTRLDLRYEFVDQKRLRAGSKQISAFEDIADTTELRTINHNLLATADHTFSNNWTVSASAPVVDRSHSHINEPTGAATFETWDFTKIGDAKVLGYYRFDNPDLTLNGGLTLGIKLPTGDYKVKNGDGTVAERALQPGSGSTDVLFGSYYSAPGWQPDSAWFAQWLVQMPVATRDGFKPGTQYLVNLGYNYPINRSLHALVQVNNSLKTRDTGVNAEPDMSGSKTVFLSPGVSYSVTHDVQLYGFLQLPVYRYMNGTQLSADWSLIVGMTMRY